MIWAEYIVAIIAFFISHTVPVRPGVRSALVQRMGARGFTLGYSALSLTVLAWVIAAAGRAPYLELWPRAPWQNYVVLVAMGVVCVVLALAIGKPNPFSFGGQRTEDFDPCKPGVVRCTRHPLLLALGIWAFAHMVPNGDLAHVILFGIFGTFALIGQRIIDRRKQRQMGAEWVELRERLRATRLKATWQFTRQTCARLSIAVVVYAGLLFLHPWLFGVNPLH